MLEQTPFGQLRGVISQALRTGAALSLGVDPLSPSPSKTTRALGGGRFVVTRRELTEPPSRDSLFTVYDPRQPWNTHLEDHVARCEWGETNRTMLQLLISGLNAMGYGQPASGITNQASAERTPDVPAVSPRQETEALPHDWLAPIYFDSIFWWNLFYLASISTSFGTTIYFIASSRLGSAKASSFIFLVPASAMLSSWGILGEKPEWTTISGGLLAISAVYLLNRKK